MGQWQRIAIARGYMRKATVVVFDEPSAALDAITENHILTDIVNKKNGIMEASGRHEELLASNETYKELYNSQK